MEVAFPQIIKSTDFSLDNKEENRKIHDNLWPKHTEILTDTDRNLFYRTGDHYNGWYAGFDKRIGLLYYLVQIKKLNKKVIGQTVTQTLVWRWHKSSLTRDITNKVVFGILLARYNAILSDKLQTDDGKRFWESLLARATDLNYHVALVDFQTKTKYTPNKDEEISDFLDRVSDKSWGKDPKFQSARFLISKSPIDEV